MWECAYVQYCTVHNTHRIWCCIYAAAHKHTKFNGGEQNILHDSCCVGQIEGCGWRRQTTTVRTEGTVAVAIYIERTPRASARWFKNENGQIFGHLECGDDEPAMRDRDCRSIHADAPWRYQGCRHIRWRVHLSGFWHSAPQQLQCEGNQNYRFPSTVVYGDNKSPKYTTRATSFILHSCTAHYIISHSAHAHIRLIIMKMQPASKRMNDDDENEIFGYNFLYASKSWLGWCSMCVGKGETADVPWRKLPIYVLCSTCTTTVDEAMTSADIIIAGAQLKCWMKIAWFPHNRLLCHYLDCLVGCICDDGGGDSVALMQFVHYLGFPFHHAIYYFGILDWTGTLVASTAHRSVNVSRWWGLSFSRPPHLLPNKKKRSKNAVADPSHGYDIENIEKDVVVICCAKCCFSDANIIFHWLLEIWLTAILREFRSFAPCSISVEVSNFCVSSSSFCTFAMKRRPKRRWMNADCCSSGLTHIHHTHTHLMRERDVQKLPKRLNKFVE